MRETVGVMGTARPSDQIAELARRVGADGTVYLALDADQLRAGGHAARGRLAEERASRCAWSSCPRARIPAELVAAEGANAISERITRPCPC